EISMPSSWTTSGVIQPAHNFRRGNRSRSRMSTSMPARRSFHAAAAPAGPPPTISTSHERMAASARVQVRAGQGNVVALARGEHHLEKLQRAGREGRHGTCQVQAPHAHELLIEHLPHALAGILVKDEPVTQRARVVQTQILDIEDGKVAGLEDA